MVDMRMPSEAGNLRGVYDTTGNHSKQPDLI